MKRIVVEYLEHGEGFDAEVAYFACWASDNIEAAKLCEEAYPDCLVTAYFHQV